MKLKRPNILFIMSDQLKWSGLRMYSEIGIETPALERLAERGVTYRYAYTPHPLCVPARTSVMTSRYPHSTGCRRNETLMPPNETHAFDIWRDAGYTTGLIGKNHCFVDLDIFDVYCDISHGGLPRGDYLGGIPGNIGMEWVRPVEAINEAHEERASLQANAQSPTIAYAVTDHPLEDYGSSVVTAQTQAFLDRIASGEGFDDGEDGSVSDKPFALWVSYPDPHEPREAPREYVDMFPPDEVVLPPLRRGEFDVDGGMAHIDDAPYPPRGEVSAAPEVNRVLYAMMGLDDDTDDDIRNLVSVHHAMVRLMDDGIGRILDKLEELDMLDDTIIVFTADHGDFMVEHNMAVKGGVFYDCLTRVPLIVSFPKGGVPCGEIDESMVNTIDILPTLLELQGLAKFEGVHDGWSGSSTSDIATNDDDSTLDANGEVKTALLRRMQGDPLPTATDAEPRIAAFSEYGAGGPPVTMSHLEECEKPWGYRTLIETLWGREAQGRRKMVRTRDWKYVTDPIADGAGTGNIADPEDELYDLENDPWELYNVAHDPANVEIVSEMRRLLAKWMIETEGSEPVLLPQSIGRS